VRAAGSRVAKFNAMMPIQTAAKPAHALGCGQKKLVSCWLKVASFEERGVEYWAGAAACAVDKISARHSVGTGRKGWRESFCSKSSGFI
jgi:hypothetical protein